MGGCQRNLCILIKTSIHLIEFNIMKQVFKLMVYVHPVILFVNMMSIGGKSCH